jgi:hypothetical protein
MDDDAMRTTLSFLFLTVCMFAGCTRYEYDIVQPPDLATHIGREEITVPREPLRYRMQVVENRLVMMIDNPTDDTIVLLGEQSSVVDPTGQSRPLRPLAIAPHSFGKLIFPPMRPSFYYARTSGWSVGVGTVVTTGGGRRRFVDDPDYFVGDEPHYLAVIDDNTLFWEWSGEGAIRLLIQFQRGNDKPFTHDWTISRSKVK